MNLRSLLYFFLVARAAGELILEKINSNAQTQNNILKGKGLYRFNRIAILWDHVK